MFPQLREDVCESVSGDGLVRQISNMSLESQLMSLDDGMSADGQCYPSSN